MSEFANRIDTQRLILKTVNELEWPSEPLLSLTKKSIDRWVVENKLDSDSVLVALIVDASSKLFFLANKSQEQVSAEYRDLSANVSKLHDQIANELEGFRLS